MRRHLILFSLFALAVGGALAARSVVPVRRAVPARPAGSVSVSPTATGDQAVWARDAASRCPEPGEACVSERLEYITGVEGPSTALETLRLLQERGVFARTADDHQAAHRIGRATAKHFGITGEAFLRCPTTFNYGCQHGFFEYALGRSPTPAEAAERICGSLGNEFPEKFIFYCYHGVGHGVLMAQAYDLAPALGVCDNLRRPGGREGCWQGVFMENVNGVLRGEAKDGIFSETDPLAPCATLPEQYRHECFINHSAWLMRVFQNDVGRAAAACLGAPAPHAEACLQSIGLMVTNPSWQSALARASETTTFEGTAWNLCTRFPGEHVRSCVIGGVDNILNFDELDTRRARAFCLAVDAPYRAPCAAAVGRSLKRQVTDQAAVAAQCATFEEPERQACRKGMGL